MLPESQKIVLIGGTAKNQGIVSALSDVCNKDFLIPAEPQIINAVGAVMYFESEQGE
jgi:activator of 2-hydroxyglutaryl-CoA dehydratase